MKKKRVFAIVFSVFFLIFLGVYFYFNATREVKFIHEYEVLSKVETWGITWSMVRSEKVRKTISMNHGVEFPDIDFNKYYFIWSDGRKLKKITYQVKSKFDWEFPVPQAITLYGEKHYPHKAFIYKIKKTMLIKQFNLPTPSEVR